MKDAKSRLRQQVRSALASMTPEELRASDDALFVRFLALHKNHIYFRYRCCQWQ